MQCNNDTPIDFPYVSNILLHNNNKSIDISTKHYNIHISTLTKNCIILTLKCLKTLLQMMIQFDISCEHHKYIQNNMLHRLEIPY